MPTPKQNKAPQQAPPEKFTVTPEGVQELVAVLNELVPGKYAKQTIFNVINTVVTPVFPAPPKRDKVRPIEKPTPKKN